MTMNKVFRQDKHNLRWRHTRSLSSFLSLCKYIITNLMHASPLTCWLYCYASHLSIRNNVYVYTYVRTHKDVQIHTFTHTRTHNSTTFFFSTEKVFTCLCLCVCDKQLWVCKYTGNTLAKWQEVAHYDITIGNR